jgi:DNA polymerase I
MDKGRILASYRKDGKLEIRDLGLAEYTTFAKDLNALPNDHNILDRKPDFDGWFKLTFFDYDTRKMAVESNPGLLFEGDVSPVRRFLSDHNCVIDRPKRCYLDIETDSSVSFSQAIEGYSRLLSWAVVDENGTPHSGVLASDDDADEARVWAELWRCLAEYDQVCAWSGDRFDFPVLEERSKMLSRRFKQEFKPYWEHRRRLLFLDHLEVFKRHHKAPDSGDEKTSLKLGSVAQALIGEGKDEVPENLRAIVGKGRSMGGSTRKLWDAGGEARTAMVKYNIQDTALLAKIEAETGYIALQQTICEATLTFCNSRGIRPMQFVDAYLLRNAFKRKTHWPSKSEPTGAEEKYEGAFVMDTEIRGIMRTVHVCDFKSLYPTVIRTWNLGSETKGVPGCISANGIEFGTVCESMLAECCRDFMSLRDFHKGEMKKYPPGTPEWMNASRKSKAYKIACNSVYGVGGCVWSRIYDVQIVEAITLGAQMLLKATRAAAIERGMLPIAGDSITPDRTVVVKDPTGRVCILPVEQLWSKCSEYTTDGGKELGRLDSWLALTGQGWMPLSTVIRHNCAKPVHMLTTKHGQVRVTEDHSLVVHGIETKPQDFVDRNMRFDTVQAPKEIADDVIDLFEHVKDFSNQHLYKGRDHTRKFIADESSVMLAGWGDPQSLRIRRFYKRGTPEHAALIMLIGAYTSDGSASLRDTTACRYLLSFCKADLNLQTRVAEALGMLSDTKLFGPYWSDTTYVVRSGTAAMACLFSALCGSGSANKRLPGFMYNLDSDSFRIFYKAISDGDGHIDEWNQLEYTSTSQQLTAGISYVLSQHGVEHAFYYRPSKKAWIFRTRPVGSENAQYSIHHSVSHDYNGYVYDLTVASAHTFVDGIGRVLLHNTDSLFIGSSSVEEFAAFTAWCNKELYPRLLAEHRCKREFQCIELAYEKCYDRLICPRGNDGDPASKRYAGSFKHYGGVAGLPICPYGETFDKAKHSKPEVKGLEFMRGDSIKYARAMQYEAIMRILAGEEDPRVLEAWVLAKRTAFFTDKMDSDQIAKSMGISKALDAYKTVGPHVRIAREMEARGEDVSEGTRIGYIVIDGQVSPTAVIPVEEFDGITFDKWHYWNKMVYPPSMRVLAGAFPNHPWSRWIARRPKKVLAGQTNLW